MSIGVVGELTALSTSAFVAATVLPGGSEAVLAAILALGATPAALAIGVATVANTLGSMVNWGIGRFFASYRDHPRFPVPRDKFDRTVRL